MVKRLLKKYKYPPEEQEATLEPLSVNANYTQILMIISTQ